MARYRLRAPRSPKMPARKSPQGDAGKDSLRSPRRRKPNLSTVPLVNGTLEPALLSNSSGLDRSSKQKLVLNMQGQLGNDYVSHFLNRARAKEEATIVSEQIIGRSEEEDQEPSPISRQVANDANEKDHAHGSAGQSLASHAPVGTVQQSDAGFIRLVPKAQLFDQNGQPIGPVIFITDPSQNVFLGEVTNGDRGFIQFFFDVDWDFHGAGLVEEKGHATLVTTTPFRVPAKTNADDDKVKFGKTRPSLLSSQGTGAALDKQPTASEDPDDLGGSVTVAPSVTYQLQTAVQGQVSPSISILFFSLTESIAVQTAVNEVDSISRAYTANLHYKSSKPPATKQLKRFAMTAEYDVNQRDPKQGELGLMEMWWNGQAGLTPLPNDQARAAVAQGQTEVFVIGHASRTGSREYNLVLAKDRADRIANFLRADRLMGKTAHITSSSAGFDDATAKGEAQTERFVAVVFEAQVDDIAPAVSPNDKADDTAVK